MKIIVWGINYAPETVGIGPCTTVLCDYLASQGHEVKMVTTWPYYPQWKKDRGVGEAASSRSTLGEVRVQRCWHYVPSRVTAARRMLHEASFVLSSFWHVLASPMELMVVISPPLLLGPAAALVGWLRSVPYAFHVQDLQPDAAVGLGLVSQGWFIRLLYALEKIAYRSAGLVSGISEAMVEAFRRKGVAEPRTHLFPNGADLSLDPARVQSGRFRERHQLSTGTFLAVYSGNLGHKQGLSQLLTAAPHLAVPDVRIVIAGDGAGRAALESRLQQHPDPRVLLLPLLPAGEYLEMLRDADVCLITQETGTGQFFLPSKLLKILSMARPVLAVADATSPLVRAIEEGGFGSWVRPHQPEELAREILRLRNDPGWLERAGQAGRAYVHRFSWSKILPCYEKALQQVRTRCAPVRSGFTK